LGQPGQGPPALAATAFDDHDRFEAGRALLTRFGIHDHEVARRLPACGGVQLYGLKLFGGARLFGHGDYATQSVGSPYPWWPLAWLDRRSAVHAAGGHRISVHYGKRPHHYRFGSKWEG